MTMIMVAKMQYFEIYWLDSSSFFFNGVSVPSMSKSSLFPILPNEVFWPTAHTTALPPPDITIDPARRQLSGFYLWLSSSPLLSPSNSLTADGSFSTFFEFSYLDSSTVIFISSIKMQSAGTISPCSTAMISPTTSSLTRISLSTPYCPLKTVTVVLLISSLILRNYFSCWCSAHALMNVAKTTPP